MSSRVSAPLRLALAAALSLPAAAGARSPLSRPGIVPARPAGDEFAQAGAAGPAAAARGADRRAIETMLDEHVKQLRRGGQLAADERTAWTVYDFTTGATLAEINADLELQSASLVKPFLALAYMNRVEKKTLVYDEQAQKQMTRMIQLSDNASADWVMRRLGGPAAVQSQLRKEFGELLPGVQIKEYIPRDGRTFRNKATAWDYNRFLLALWRDQLPGSKEIKRLMGLPKRDRLRTGVPLPQDTAVVDKTGSTSHLCGDIGVLTVKGPDGKEYSYAMVGIIEKKAPARHYFSWMRARGNVIREVSYMMYRSIGALHGFAAQ